MQREMERLLGHFAGSKPPMVQFSGRAWEPAIDVYETDNAVVVIAELAGVDENEMEIVVERDKITIRGERRATGFGTKKTYCQMEISSGLFERTVVLPTVVDIGGTRASRSNGLVEIILPKIKQKRTHRVDVKIIEVRRV